MHLDHINFLHCVLPNNPKTSKLTGFIQIGLYSVFTFSVTSSMKFTSNFFFLYQQKDFWPSDIEFLFYFITDQLI